MAVAKMKIFKNFWVYSVRDGEKKLHAKVTGTKFHVEQPFFPVCFHSKPFPFVLSK